METLNWLSWTVASFVFVLGVMIFVHELGHHLMAKYFGNQVEGWIDGKRVLAAEIAADHPGIKNGRIALWTFETWVEFDNVKVTRLVPIR